MSPRVIRSRPVGKLRRGGTTPAHRIELGSYANYNEARFETEIESRGGTFTWRRRFFQNQTWSGMSTTITNDANAGYKVYFSFRPNGTTWAQIAAGNEDARWTGIGNGLAAISNAGAWCFNHEPENDVLTYGSSANGAAFVAAWERVASIIKPLAPNWQASICLFDMVFPSWEFTRGGNWVATPDAHDWMSPDMDLLGVDYYNYRGASDGGSHWADDGFSHVYDHRTAVQDFLDHAAVYNVPLCFPEFAWVIKDPAGAFPNDKNTQSAWLSDFATVWARHPKINSLMWFEVNEQDQADKGNYSITDDDHPPLNDATVNAVVAIGA
jgi:hypothetical protein